MKNKLTLLIGAVLICALAPQIFAEPLITGLFYDPEGTDTGFEWIELYNPTNASINLADYALFKGNGDKVNDWAILPTLSGSLLPQSFFLIGEANVSDVDLQLKLALFNGPDALAIRSTDNETVDLVGYGALPFDEYRLGSSTIDVASGKALARKFDLDNGTYVFSQTQNNSVDWQVADPQPRNSLYAYVVPLIQNTSVTLVVPALPVLITNATLSDDQPAKAGTQWSLVGKKRLELHLQDESAAFDASHVQVSLVRNGISRLLAAQVQSVEFITDANDQASETIVILSVPLTSDLSAGNYSLQITLGESPSNADLPGELSFAYSVELLPSIGMLVCDDMLLLRDDTGTYRGVCAITNIGNVLTSVGLNLTFGTQLPVQPYYVDAQQYVPLANTTLTIAAGETKQVTIVTNVSRIISHGSYEGTLQVRAWATQ